MHRQASMFRTQELAPSSSNVTTMPNPSPIPNATTVVPSTFEFTKRKRWADLLIHELSEAIILVLSNECKVLFCSKAVSELLGWRDADFIDKDLVDFVNDEDRYAFRGSFDQSLCSRAEMLSYVRFRCQTEYAAPAKEVLFEVKGYPHYIDNEPHARCFFAVAKPYPSRNAAMLNTFLELKVENERLQQRLADLRVRFSPPPSVNIGPSMASIYPVQSASRESGSLITHRSTGDVTAARYPTHNTSTPYDNVTTQGNHHQPRGHTNTSDMYGSYPLAPHQPVEDNYGEEATRRKRIRKVHAAEQYVCVTCGRTDSPEWRKGPQGPKTLCNACGLRWAKQIRTKQDEEQLSAGPST